MLFEVVVPADFEVEVERIKRAFDVAEEEAEDGTIPRNRRGLQIEKRMTIISDVPDAELFVSDALTTKLSDLISGAIGRECKAHIVFVNGGKRRPNDDRYAADFDLTFVTLLD
ncbi:hypothetical protein LMG29739_05801 [Paraburkholderia solisilvae]|uniref:Uncharacterized protein n=2 Tax=Paraburkholderia solisilvae TaxID=624376 RepID=A0A6J5EV91_9BURK|nr:hypothetical protein LMG29739_05801 [Paraburkholderia solisilvae]